MTIRRSALLPVQAAVYRHLTTDSALMALAPVYDEVPQGTPYPYIELSEFIEEPDNTTDQQGRTVLVSIFAWAQVPGFKLLEQILDALLRLLDEDAIPDISPTLGWSIWSNMLVRDEVVRDRDGITRQLATQFRVQVTRDELGQ